MAGAALLAPLLSGLMAMAMAMAMASPAAAAAVQDRCESWQPGSHASQRTDVTVDVHDNGYRIDNSLPYRTLTRMKRAGANGGVVLGLTRAESRVAVSVEGTIIGDPETGTECLRPLVNVSLSYEPIVIYVGREFEPGSCAYREILAHEMRHLKAYVDYLPKVESRVLDRMAQRFDGRPVVAPRGQALHRVQQELDRTWMPFLKRQMATAKARQAAIDSPKEYARLGKVCRGEVQSLIGSTRRSRS
jgi:hypothetical protein